MYAFSRQLLGQHQCAVRSSFASGCSGHSIRRSGQSAAAANPPPPPPPAMRPCMAARAPSTAGYSLAIAHTHSFSVHTLLLHALTPFPHTHSFRTCEHTLHVPTLRSLLPPPAGSVSILAVSTDADWEHQRAVAEPGAGPLRLRLQPFESLRAGFRRASPRMPPLSNPAP